MTIRNIISCFAFLMATQSLAQSSGVIRYEEKTDVHKMLPPGMESMKTMIPRYSSTVFRLYFNESESIYKAIEVDQPPVQAFGGGGFGGPGGPPGGGAPGGGPPGGVVVIGGGGGPPPGGGSGGFRGGFGGTSLTDQVHTGNDMITAAKEFLGQSYFIHDTLKVAPWKFGAEKRTILGYECSVAYYTDNSNPAAPVEVTAWYTAKIRPFVGPDYFNSVPGGILALDFNAGEHYWVARKIELRPLTEEEKIEVPIAKKNAKPATIVSFEKAKVEQMEQMRSRMGGMRR